MICDNMGCNSCARNNYIYGLDEVSDNYKTKKDIAPVEPVDKICIWEKNLVYGSYKATCIGHLLPIDEFVYCPYCGKPIKIKD
jgi:hypothetical protein